MPNDTKQIHDVETGEINIIELTDEEQEVRDAEIVENLAAKKVAQLEKATAKAAILDRLGITADEAKLILG